MAIFQLTHFTTKQVKYVIVFCFQSLT